MNYTHLIWHFNSFCFPGDATVTSNDVRLSVPIDLFLYLSYLSGYSEVQLPVSQSTAVDQGMAISEPAPEFIENIGF